jgi:hypothetical protein
LGWRFRFCQGDNQSLVQTFVSFGAFLCGRDLGLFGDVGVQKKTKGPLLSRRYRSPAHPHPVRILRFGKLGNLLSTIRRIQMAFNSALTILGILRTMYDARTNLAHQVSAELQKHFPQWLLRTVIPRTVRLAEAPSHGLPIIYFPLDGSADVLGELREEYRNLPDMNLQEHISLWPLVFLTSLVGVYPPILLRIIQPAMEQVIEWMMRVHGF